MKNNSNKSQLYSKRSSISRISQNQYFKTCSTKQFVNRFNILPIYNAIHQHRKNVSQSLKNSKLLKQCKNKNEKLKQSLIRMNKLPLSMQKNTIKIRDKKFNSFSRTHTILSQERRSLPAKVLKIQIQQSILNKLQNLNYHTKIQKSKWSHLIKETINTKNNYIKNAKNKADCQNLSMVSLKSNQQFCDDVLFKNENRMQKVNKKPISLIRRVQTTFERKIYCPFDDGMLERIDKIESNNHINKQTIPNLINHKQSLTCQEKNIQISKKQIPSQNFVKTVRLSFQKQSPTPSLNLIQSKKLIKCLNRPSLKFNIEKMQKINFKSTISDNKENTLIPLKLKNNRFNYIRNFIKTVDTKNQNIFANETNVSNSISIQNKYECSESQKLFKQHKQYQSNNCLNMCGIQNSKDIMKKRKSKINSVVQRQQNGKQRQENNIVSLVSILHPQGQFSRDFDKQFNPW